jgi:MFS family permease
VVPAEPLHREPSTSASIGKGRLFEPSALWIALVSFFSFFPLDAIMMYIATYGKDRGFAHISLFFPVHAVGMILTYLFLGRIADHVGAKRLFLSSLALVLLTYVMLAAAKDEIMVAVAAFIFGIGLGLESALLRDFLIRLSPKASLGAANATYMTASDLGYGSGSVVLGFVLQGAGFTVFFLVSLVATALAVGVYLAYVRPQLARHEAQQTLLALSRKEA